MSVARRYGLLRTTTTAFSRPIGFSILEIAPRRSFSAKPKAQQWTCPSCVRKARQSSMADEAIRSSPLFKRPLSTSMRRHEEQRPTLDPKPTASTPAAQPPSEPDVHSTALPSHTERERGPASKRLSHIMDSLLARASLASQRINNYTGTDYSGIEAIRSRIIAQEQSVRDLHNTVDLARTSHRDAHSKQSGAQKEIVSLLERKSSWSPTDLERYMSLVRSEHTMEQDVATAKDDLAAAERELEGARSLLERLERKQYHEEQIWSDTIRRNSTWVTFGLMGVNIVLLLAQILLFEPYRRRKIVREVKVALDEKTRIGVESAKQVEEIIDEVVEPVGVSVEAVEKAAVEEEPVLEFSTNIEAAPSNATLAAGEVLLEEAVKLETSRQEAPASTRQYPDTWTGSWESAMESLQDMFSERIIQVKKVDLTTMALQGAATGVATMGLLFVVFRPR